jgi:hypothetical protein
MSWRWANRAPMYQTCVGKKLSSVLAAIESKD